MATPTPGDPPTGEPTGYITDPLTGYITDPLTGICVFGATGSGKTSGPAKHLAGGYLSAGWLCIKKTT